MLDPLFLFLIATSILIVSCGLAIYLGLAGLAKVIEAEEGSRVELYDFREKDKSDQRA